MMINLSLHLDFSGSYKCDIPAAYAKQTAGIWSGWSVESTLTCSV